MAINSLSVTSTPGFSRNFRSIDHQNQAKTAKVQAQTKEPASVKVSITSDPSQIKPANRNVIFAVDSKTNDVVIKLLNRDTGEEIKQIPTEDALRLSQRISEFQDKLQGLG